jgi:uncharacterized protein
MSVILVLISCYLGLVAMVQLFEYINAYHPSSIIEPPPPGMFIMPEEHFLKTDHHTRIHLWYFKNSGSDTIAILFHGNGGNNSHRWRQIRALYDTGLSVVIFDYRGYGKSSGFPSEQGLYRDGQAVYQWITALGYPPEKIVLIGTSLGGAVAAEVALHNPVRALVLECTFTDKFDMAKVILPFIPIRWFSVNQFTTFEKLPQIHTPVLIVHGDRDEMIPYPFALKNFGQAREPKFLYTIRGSTHNDYLETGGAEYLSALHTFITDLTLKQ